MRRPHNLKRYKSPQVKRTASFRRPPTETD